MRRLKNSNRTIKNRFKNLEVFIEEAKAKHVNIDMGDVRLECKVYIQCFADENGDEWKTRENISMRRYLDCAARGEAKRTKQEDVP